MSTGDIYPTTGTFEATPLDKIFAMLTEILARLDKLEGGKPGPEPAKTGGLYDFVRPVPVEPRHGAGVRMASPDAEEALLRAKYCVRWNGDVALTESIENEAWEEIERLKALDPALIAKYQIMDTTFAGFALLTGLIDPSKYDGFLGQQHRDSWKDWNVQRFINLQFGVDATPSGNE